MTYKFSLYNHYGRLKTGQYFIYNVFSSSSAILTEKELNAINKNTINESEWNDFYTEASGLGFIVPKSENETAKLAALRNSTNFSVNRAGFQILPTTACNAQCFYCYEKDYKAVTMTNTIVEQTAEFIMDYCENVDDIYITWFGGEPFICESIMSKISEKLIAFAKKNNKRYFANAITNGSLISSENIEAIVHKYHISSVQITLDGRKEKHIKRKRFIDKDITYDKILESISLLANNNVQVQIRINVDRDNAEDCLAIIDDLFQLNTNKEYLWPYIAPLYSSKGDKNCFKKEELSYIFEKMYFKLIDCGFIKTVKALPISFKNAACCAKMLNNYVIDPEGNIFKCEHLLYDPKEIVGNVFDGIIFNSAMVKWCSADIPQNCMECSYLPICQAGCSAAEKCGFGYGRCSYITFIHNAIINVVDYLIEKEGEINDSID